MVTIRDVSIEGTNLIGPMMSALGHKRTYIVQNRCPLGPRSGHLAPAIAKTRIEDMGALAISPERAQASFCDATTNSWKLIDPPTYFQSPGFARRRLHLCYLSRRPLAPVDATAMVSLCHIVVVEFSSIRRRDAAARASPCPRVPTPPTSRWGFASGVGRPMRCASSLSSTPGSPS